MCGSVGSYKDPPRLSLTPALTNAGAALSERPFRFAIMSHIARGTFDVKMRPGQAEAGGDINRFDFTKTFDGDICGSSVGVMLSCGDPQAGEAGYVAIETVRGRVGDREGGFALQQLGTMSSGSQNFIYEVVPGSGQDALEGIVGALDLTVDDDGTHCYTLNYDL